jgi:hypothetical protein
MIRVSICLPIKRYFIKKKVPEKMHQLKKRKAIFSFLFVREWEKKKLIILILDPINAFLFLCNFLIEFFFHFLMTIKQLITWLLTGDI